MKLANISRHFNNDPVYDAYTGVLLFQAHNTAHDDKASASASARRRTMRTVPGITPPARRAVRISGDYWIIGSDTTDTYNGQPVRLKFGLKQSTGLMTLLTPGAACAGAGGLQLHTQQDFYHDLVNPLTESEIDVQFSIFCANSEPVIKGSFLKAVDGRLYRVRNCYTAVDEFLTMEADQLDPDAQQSATFTQNGVLDIATDTLPAVSDAVQVIQTDDSKFYRFRDAVESDRKPGDRAVFLRTTDLAVQAGAKFTMLGSTWQVRAFQPEQDATALHVRLA